MHLEATREKNTQLTAQRIQSIPPVAGPGVKYSPKYILKKLKQPMSEKDSIRMNPNHIIKV